MILLGCSFVSNWADVIACCPPERRKSSCSCAPLPPNPFPAVLMVIGLFNTSVQTAGSAESNKTHRLSLPQLRVTEGCHEFQSLRNGAAGACSEEQKWGEADEGFTPLGVVSCYQFSSRETTAFICSLLNLCNPLLPLPKGTQMPPVALLQREMRA